MNVIGQRRRVFFSSLLVKSLYCGISIYCAHKVDVQRRDSTFAPSPQTYATAAFGEGRVREGANRLWLRCHSDSRVSAPAVSRSLRKPSESQSRHPAPCPVSSRQPWPRQQTRLGCRPDRHSTRNGTSYVVAVFLELLEPI